MAARRQNFAEELAALCDIRSEPLLGAFLKVRRENFLPPGPWSIEGIDGARFNSPDSDPSNILHSVGVVLSRHDLQPIHCANPALVAKAIQSTEFRSGDHVLHVGAGLGYFTAIMAQLVGPTGRITAAEIDEELAAQAAKNLATWSNVTMVGDALTVANPIFDVIFSSAGMGTIPTDWIDALTQGGRMMLPLTGSNGSGFTFLFRKDRRKGFIEASLQSFVRFYPCLGLRQEADLSALDAALINGRAPFVKWLRRDKHFRAEQCWLHGEDWCITTAPTPAQ